MGEDLKYLTVERGIMGLLGKTQTLEELPQVQWHLKESMGHLGRLGALYLSLSYDWVIGRGSSYIQQDSL